MIIYDFDPEPDKIFPRFWDRNQARNAVTAMAWQNHVQTEGVGHACLRTQNQGNPRQRRTQVRAQPPLRKRRPGVTERLSSKAISPAIWRYEMRSSTPSPASSAAPSMTSSRTPGSNNLSSASPCRYDPLIAAHRSASE
jgi:hypothetical protein